MSRRTTGEGTVYQRQDGRWTAALTVGGKRRTVYGKTRAEAARKLAELRRQASAGSLPDPGKRTIADLLDAWLSAVAPTLKPRTLADYRQVATLYILPVLGTVRLSKVEPSQLQSLYAGLQAKSKHRAARKVHAVLHRAFTLAVLWRWLADNPANRVLPPAYHARRKALWNREELATFLAGTQDHWLQPLWMVALASGCRIGELLALTWQDVDLSAATISVNKAGQHIAGQWVVSTPKTASGARTLTLPPEGLAALRRQKAQQAQWRLQAGPEWTPSGLVFTGDTGKPLHASDVANAMRKQCLRLGLPPVTPHGLRHLHASLLLAQGLPVPAVSARLGHANPSITMAVYAHAIGKGDAAAAEAIGRVLAGGGR